LSYKQRIQRTYNVPTRGRIVSDRLRKAGFKIVDHYHDPRAHGIRHAIEIARKGEPKTKAPWDLGWEDMSEHKDEVEKIVKEVVPEAEFEGYRGSPPWIVRYTWLEKRD